MTTLLVIVLAAGIIAGVAYFLVGTVLVALGMRLGAGRDWVRIGAWLTALPLLVLLGVGTLASGIVSTGPRPPPTSDSVTQGASVQLRFIDPYAGSPTETGVCWHSHSGGPVNEVVVHSAGQADARWGPNLELGELRLNLNASAVGNRLLIELRTQLTEDRWFSAYYRDSAGGSTELNAAADAMSGVITFTGLGHLANTDFERAPWPDTISGSFSWGCRGPEQSSSP